MNAMEAVISESGRACLRWALVDGIGPILFKRLLMHFNTPEAALEAPIAELEKVHGVGTAKADAIARARDQVRLDEEIDSAAEHDVRIICPLDPAYPPGLKEIPDAPIVLYVKGELRDTDTVAVAVVGTRRCSIYGSEQARRFGELLAGAGFTLISGLARGIDSFAHHGAADAGGRSIAILGSGLTEVYPPENRALAEKLLANGAWISELPMRAAVRRENFPSRNRIIAGMSLGTLVIEAPMRSGALITARLASDYNREVFAVPGRLQEPNAAGTNAIIRDGIAKLVTNLEDILHELGELGEKLLQAQDPSPRPAAVQPDESKATASSPRQMDLNELAPDESTAGNFNASERKVLGLVPYEPVLQDVILRAAELPTGEVLAAVTRLELKGLIRRLPGNLIVRAGRT